MNLLKTEINGTPVGNGLFRFNLLFMVPIWAIAAMWLISHYGNASEFSLTVTIVSLTLVSVLSTFFWIMAIFNTQSRLLNIKSRVALAPESHDPAVVAGAVQEDNLLTHLIVVTCYKEPIGLIVHTLESLALQTDANRIRVAVGFESLSPDLENKKRQLNKEFSSKFLDFEVTIHPSGVHGEIAGKCSNVNYTLRTVVKLWGLDDENRAKKVILTTCDTDNLFHKNHFFELKKAFLSNPNRHQMIWQAPLFYDWNLDGSSFFTRNTGHMRTLFLCGVLAPLSLNSMSIQSLSLDLCRRGDYFHPAYQMEDILNAVRWMTEIQNPIKIECLNLPVLSGPTSGKHILEEAKEWATQARRWTIGSAEVFHYFFSRFGRIPFKTASTWGSLYFFYYAILIPVAPLVPMVWLSLGEFGLPNDDTQSPFSLRSVSNSIMLVLSVVQFFCLVSLHLLRFFWATLLPVKEKIGFGRRVSDFILFPICQLGYAAVAIWSLHVLAIRGRAVCGHVPSNKASLGEGQMRNKPFSLSKSTEQIEVTI